MNEYRDHEKPTKGLWVTNSLLIGEIVAVIAAFTLVQMQFQAQNTRTDKLYEMFIDLVKEKQQ